MSQLVSEILEQPQTLERLLREGRPYADQAAAAVRKFAPEWVLIAARGSSDNAARYGQYLLGAHNQLGVGLAIPSLFTLYGGAPSLKRALVIGISQSGQSPDIVAVVDEARRQGGLTLSLTNDLDSPLARAAAHSIPLLAGHEKAVAATKTYTAELMALAMLSAGLEGDAGRWQALENVPNWVRSAISMNPDLRPLAQPFKEAVRLVVIGRGFNYSTAFEIALKVKETSYAVAEPYSVADLLHGPVAMIDEGFPVLVVAPSGKGSEDAPKLLKLLEERGARVLVVSDREDLGSKGHARLSLPTGVPEWVSPMVSVVPGQLWAQALATSMGRDPDRPRGLSKVTLTR